MERYPIGLTHTESVQDHALHFEAVGDNEQIRAVCSCGWATMFNDGEFISGRFRWSNHASSAIYQDSVTLKILTAVKRLRGIEQVDLAAMEVAIREALKS